MLQSPDSEMAVISCDISGTGNCWNWLDFFIKKLHLGVYVYTQYIYIYAPQKYFLFVFSCFQEHETYRLTDFHPKIVFDPNSD